MNRSQRTTVLLLFILLGVLLSGSPAEAQRPYTLIVPLGGERQITGGPAQYLQILYSFSLGLGAFLAMLMIVWGAVAYTISAGNASRQEDAKDRITNAVYGLVLLLGAYLVLQLLNPQLVALRNPDIAAIPPSSTLSPSPLSGTIAIHPFITEFHPPFCLQNILSWDALSVRPPPTSFAIEGARRDRPGNPPTEFTWIATQSNAPLGFAITEDHIARGFVWFRVIGQEGARRTLPSNFISIEGPSNTPSISILPGRPTFYNDQYIQVGIRYDACRTTEIAFEGSVNGTPNSNWTIISSISPAERNFLVQHRISPLGSGPMFGMADVVLIRLDWINNAGARFLRIVTKSATENRVLGNTVAFTP